MPDPVGLIETGPIAYSERMPVRHDPNADPAFLTQTAYLLSDGVSLMEPIPVVITNSLSCVDSAGNLRDVQAFNIANLPEPDE